MLLKEPRGKIHLTMEIKIWRAWFQNGTWQQKIKWYIEMVTDLLNQRHKSSYSWRIYWWNFFQKWTPSISQLLLVSHVENVYKLITIVKQKEPLASVFTPFCQYIVHLYNYSQNCGQAPISLPHLDTFPHSSFQSTLAALLASEQHSLII